MGLCEPVTIIGSSAKNIFLWFSCLRKNWSRQNIPQLFTSDRLNRRSETKRTFTCLPGLRGFPHRQDDLQMINATMVRDKGRLDIIRSDTDTNRFTSTESTTLSFWEKVET